MNGISCRVAIRNVFDDDPRHRSPLEVIEALRSLFPGEWTDGTIRAHLIGLSTNHPSARHYPHLQTFAFLTQGPDGHFAVGSPLADGPLEGSHPIEPRSTGSLLEQPSMPRRVYRLERMAGRAQDLAADFVRYLGEFEKRTLFRGPSAHFHVRAIERRRTHDTLRSAIADTDLLELVYATLASWGMHRMGPTGAKLVDFAVFCDGIRSQIDRLEPLESLVISDLDDPVAVANTIWEAVSGAHLSDTATQVVAGTKALHHLLPDLIPPVDREYTIRFCHENKMMNMGDEAAFKEVYPVLAGIARRRKDHLAVNDRSPFNTSGTKVLDNAIIGYVLSELKAHSEDI